MGIFKRLKNIEDNLSGNDNDDNDNKGNEVGLFKILKDIKNKGLRLVMMTKLLVKLETT